MREATVEYQAVKGERFVYDVKEGKNSLMATSGLFHPSLLQAVFDGYSPKDESATLLTKARRSETIRVPDALILCPFGTYKKKGRRDWESSSELDGLDAGRDGGVSYECWTQVKGKLRELYIRPGLELDASELSCEIYYPYDMPAPAPRREVNFMRVNDVTFLFRAGTQIHVSERLVVRICSKSSKVVKTSDFLAVMFEDIYVPYLGDLPS